MRSQCQVLTVAEAIVLAAIGLSWWATPANAQLPEAPYVPSPQSVSISNHIAAGTVSVQVSIALPTSCERVGDWGTAVQTPPFITVNSACWTIPGAYCLQYVSHTNHTYQLGYLAPGNYLFQFGAWWQTVATHEFTVPAIDSDGDGMLDYEEGIAGTDPLNPNSVLRLLGHSLEQGQVRITWQGGTTARQYVERRAMLIHTNAAWLCVFTNHPPTPVLNTWCEPIGTNAAQFFRIRVER